MKIFYAYLKDDYDNRNDEVLKIRAKDIARARKYAKEFCKIRGIGKAIRIYTSSKFKQYDGRWYDIMKGIYPERA